MIIVSGMLKVNPDNHDKFLEAVATLVAASRAEEGVVDYGFYTDPDERGAFRVFEEYADEAALASHSASPHLVEFMGSLGSFGVTGASILRYTVSEKGNLM